MNFRISLTALALAVALSNSAMAQTEQAITYVVKPGDTLFALGRDYLVRPGDYRLIQRANRIADPRRLRVGTNLSIDPSLLKSQPIEGRLVAASGAVRLFNGETAAPAVVGMAIREGARLTTGPNAFATFELPDESRVTIPSNSDLHVVRLRDILLTSAPQRIFSLDQGRSELDATPNPNPNARFQLRTRHSISAVRGTEFRVSQPASGQRAVTEVLEGGVGVAALEAGSAETLVSQSFALTISPQGPGRLTPLLAPPQFADLRNQEEPEVRFAVRPVAGAGAYRMQLANDAGFVDIFAETESPDGAATFSDVKNGTYFVRATAIDPDGIEGQPVVSSFQRDLNTLEPGQAPAAEALGKLRRYLFRWNATGEGVRTYRFQLFAAADTSRPVVDLPGLSDPQVSVTDLPPGAYTWRVIAVRFKDGRFSQKAGASQTLQIAG